MPVEVIETQDTLTNIVQFSTSSIYEMLVSLHTLVAGRRHQDWQTQAKHALGAEFWAELEKLYRPLHEGVLFFELPVDYTDQHDVPGFINYVRTMDPATFVFYLIGRVAPITAIREANVAPDFVIDAINYYCEATAHSPYTYIEAMRKIVAEVTSFQRRLTDLWERYWNDFFKEQVPALVKCW